MELPTTSPAAPPQFASTDCFARYRAPTYCNAQLLEEALPHHDILQRELFGKNYSQKRMSHQFFSDDYLGDPVGLEGENPRLSGDPLQAPTSQGVAALSTLDDISSHFSPSSCSTPPPPRIFDSCDSFAQVERSGSPRKAVSIGNLGQRRGFKGAPLKTSSTTPQGSVLSLPSAKSVRSSGRMSPTTPRTPISSIVNLCTSFSPKSMRSSKQAPLEVYGQEDPFAVTAPSFYTLVSAGSTPPWNDDDLNLYLDQEKDKSLHKGGSRSRRSSNAHRIPGHVMKTTIYNVSVGPSLSTSRPLATPTLKTTSELPKPLDSSALPVTPSDVGVVLTPPSPPKPTRPPSSVSLSESLKVLIETGASFVDDDPFTGSQAPAPKSVVSTDVGDSSVYSARQERSRATMVQRSGKATLELMDPPRQSKAGFLGDEAISNERSLVTSKETQSKVKERGHRTTVKVKVTTLGESQGKVAGRGNPSPEVSGAKFDHHSNRPSPSSTRATSSSFPDSLKANVQSDTAVPTAKQNMSTKNIVIETSNGDTVASDTIKKKRRFSAPSAWPSPSKPPGGLSFKAKPASRVAMRDATNTSHSKATSCAGVVPRPVSWIHNLTLAQSGVKVKIIPPTPVLKGPKTFSAALDHSLLVVVDPDDDEAEEDIVHGDDAKQRRWSRGVAELVAIVNTFDLKTGQERAQLQHSVFPISSSEGSLLTKGTRDSLALFRSSVK